MRSWIFKKKIFYPTTIFCLLFFGFWFSLPKKLFRNPSSLVLVDKDGVLLGAKIASDGQWRFPQNDSIPEKFKDAIITAEDRRFYFHPGIDPIAIARAAFQNISHRQIISGASTITMQVIRLSRNGKPRTFFQKIIEAILAFRIEFSFSKDKILSLYVSNAPFGGNVVGLDAASWRYYGKSSKDLTWAEAATLAVLPNNPSLIYPGKNKLKLLERRNKLLAKLYNQAIIDSITYSLSKLEALPGKPLPLPSLAPHLLSYAFKSKLEKTKIVKTTISAKLQESVNQIVARHYTRLKPNGIHNIAALIIDVKREQVLVYVGNTSDYTKKVYGCHVDVIRAPRSPGSTLKPLLYAFMQQEGTLLPNMLIPDIPTFINSYTPKNFSRTYEGAIPAKQALARSLNVPAVHLLRKHTPAKFLHELRRLGLTTLTFPPEHYGLSLILGGCEVTLWDLASVYAGMAKTLTDFNQFNTYSSSSFDKPQIFIENPKKPPGNEVPMLNAASIWLTFDAILHVARPDQEKYWQTFASSRKIAWKTGTSFGNRDAWSIGVTPEYVVGVWVGNGNGQGSPALTGINSAAPVLFDIFNLLPKNGKWFKKPVKEMSRAKICEESGYLATENCEKYYSSFVAKSTSPQPPCPFHKKIFLDSSKKYMVHSDCESIGGMVPTSWFILPPRQEYYYAAKHPGYKKLPPYRSDCKKSKEKFDNKKKMALLYPQEPSKIYVPVNLDGTSSKTIFEVAHTRKDAIIYWHLDQIFIGITDKGYHKKELNPKPGKHILTLIDDQGVVLRQKFEILYKKN